MKKVLFGVVLSGLVVASVACGEPTAEDKFGGYCDKLSACTGGDRQSCVTGNELKHRQSAPSCQSAQLEAAKCLATDSVCSDGQLALAMDTNAGRLCMRTVQIYNDCVAANPSTSTSTSTSSSSSGGGSSSAKTCETCLDDKCGPSFNACVSNAACVDCYVDGKNCDSGGDAALALAACKKKSCSAACN